MGRESSSCGEEKGREKNSVVCMCGWMWRKGGKGRQVRICV